MKNTFKFSFSIFCLAIFLLSSCSKDAPIQPQKDLAPAPLLSEDMQVCFDNPNNPYEYVGQQHNLGLDAIAATPGFENLTEEEAHNIATQSIEQNMGMDLDLNYEEVAVIYEDMTQEQPLVVSTQMLLDDDVISVNAYNKLLELQEIIDMSEGPEQLGNAIINLENDILQDDSFSEIDLKTVLGSTSMARHSFCYWMTASMDTASPWYAFVGEDANGLKGSVEARWGWWKRIIKKIRRVIRADIAGFQYGMRRFWVWTWRGPRIIWRSIVIGINYSYRAIWV